ncbi:glycosyl transferase family 1 [Thermotoga sp. Ku-13t]|uniref:glycosyltransferase n=1 Tax=Thermotoga sp. Ku-13t TaxID=1755813 RepID=UPI00169881BB|nr:glycosyltransferase [Thermotoga sp. Ku-13t]KAF2958592.1 glycosyl transferase family 1 [Thermotoga sp. Ku-13t]
MRKVLQIITRSDWAGAQKVMYNIVYGLKKYYSEEFEVEVAFGKENGMLIAELEKIGIKYHIINDLVREVSPIKDFKAYLQIKSLIKQNRYDVVHTHSSKAGILGRIAAKRAGVKKVIHTYHGFWGIEQYTGIKRALLILAERIAAKYADYLVLLCKRDLEKAKKWKIGQESQYKIIHNAIIPEERIERGLLRKELNIPDNIKIVGNVARLDRQKNPMRFLRIAEEVVKQRDDVVFVWIGGSVVEDEYGAEVQKYLQEHESLKDKAYILSFRKDANKLMADFDVFLLTSDSEGAPLVVLEAQSLGIPVVSTDVGCVGEMIGNQNVTSDVNKLKHLLLTILEKGKFNNYVLQSYEDFVALHVDIYKGDR